MKNNNEFFSSQSIIVEKKHPITLYLDQWRAVSDKILDQLTHLEQGDNVHKCWLASLASLKIKIDKKVTKGSEYSTVGLKPNEFFALKELVIDLPKKGAFFLATVASIIDELDKINR